MVDTAIVGLALKDEKNLETALRIGKNFDEIRHDVMRTFLRCVRDGLKEWAKKNNEEWEVVETWPGGNWIEQPRTEMAASSSTQESLACRGGRGVSG